MSTKDGMSEREIASCEADQAEADSSMGSIRFLSIKPDVATESGGKSAAKECDHSQFCKQCIRSCEVDREMRRKFTLDIGRYRQRKNVLNTGQIVDLMVCAFYQGKHE